MINRFLGKKEEEKRSSLPIVDPELVEALFNEDDDVQSDDEFEDDSGGGDPAPLMDLKKI